MSMAGYTKLFNSILASTIWRENDKTRIVWITLLAMSDKDGVCEGSIPGLADLARVTVDECEAALDVLSSPDKYSRTSEHEGRRIEILDGTGWQLLNHAKYRAKMSEDERREYNRQKQAEHRAKVKAEAVINCQTLSNGVNDSQSQSAMSAHTDTEAHTDTDKEENPEAALPPPEGFTEKKDRDLVLAEWFDVIAPLMGAKSRFGLTRKADWKRICHICISEGYQISELSDAITRVLNAPNFEMRYFKPDKALDELRVPTKQGKNNGTKQHPNSKALDEWAEYARTGEIPG